MIKRKRLLEVLVFLFLLILMLSGFFYEYFGYFNYYEKDKNSLYYKEVCEKYLETGIYEDETLPDDIDENSPIVISLKDGCKDIVKLDEVTYSTFFYYHEMMSNSIFSPTFPFFFPLLFLLPILYYLSRIFSSKQIKQNLLRQNYKDYVKDIFKKAYSSIWILPALLLIAFLISFLISGHFFIGGYETADFDPVLLYNPIFYIEYILIILLNLGIYINVGLAVISKTKNWLLSLVESYSIILVFCCFIEKLGIKLHTLNFITDSLYFNQLNLFFLPNYLNLKTWIILLLNILYFAISFIIVILCYKNKEKLIQMCER